MNYPVPRKENPIYLFWKILWAFSFTTGAFSLVVAFFSLNTGFTGMTPPATYFVLVTAAAIVLPLYTLPAYCAYRKDMKGAKRILLCNLFLGWTLIGYILCAVRVAQYKISD